STESPSTLARRRLIALWPIVRSGRGFGASYKAWVHDYCCCGAPLLDNAQAFAALAVLVGHLRAGGFSPAALLAPQLRADGPTAAVLRRFAALNGLTLDLIARYDRAALDAARQGAETAGLVSRKKAKELRRQLRRLGDSGPVLFGMAREGAELDRQIESFLALEIKGWKGRDGGAFANRPSHADFLRTMIRAMAEQGKCRIFWLSHSGRVIASNIVLVAGGEAYFWKTAYDEAFAFASPGVQLTLNMTDALLREPGLRLIDSCATPDHPMIDRLWRDQAPMADVILSLEAGRSFRFRGALWRERLRRRFREMAKIAWTTSVAWTNTGFR
ncbi:GNAT family N-acetyltransferase, partial [Rhodoblastus sp.]|uniref:GNAT family N-acetyltransferase n=1 Tax=Rhodoblastus sp. TaxID=1962975 RepID=UPI0035B08644